MCYLNQATFSFCCVFYAGNFDEGREEVSCSIHSYTRSLGKINSSVILTMNSFTEIKHPTTFWLNRLIIILVLFFTTQGKFFSLRQFVKLFMKELWYTGGRTIKFAKFPLCTYGYLSLIFPGTRGAPTHAWHCTKHCGGEMSNVLDASSSQGCPKADSAWAQTRFLPLHKKIQEGDQGRKTQNLLKWKDTLEKKVRANSEIQSPWREGPCFLCWREKSIP